MLPICHLISYWRIWFINILIVDVSMFLFFCLFYYYFFLSISFFRPVALHLIYLNFFLGDRVLLCFFFWIYPTWTRAFFLQDITHSNSSLSLLSVITLKYECYGTLMSDIWLRSIRCYWTLLLPVSIESILLRWVSLRVTKFKSLIKHF